MTFNFIMIITSSLQFIFLTLKLKNLDQDMSSIKIQLVVLLIIELKQLSRSINIFPPM